MSKDSTEPYYSLQLPLNLSEPLSPEQAIANERVLLFAEAVREFKDAYIKGYINGSSSQDYPDTGYGGVLFRRNA